MEDVYEFGPFRLETKERRLLRDGRPVRLRGKVLDSNARTVQGRITRLATTISRSRNWTALEHLALIETKLQWGRDQLIAEL